MSLDVLAEKLSEIQKTLADIQGHVAVLNDGSHQGAIQVAVLTSRLDAIEKILWIVFTAAIGSIIGTIWSIVFHRRNKQ